MEKLKKEIFDKVKITRFKSADCTDVREYGHLVKDNIWDNAINTAMKEKKRVYIPNIGKEILINSSIVMDDDCVLIVDKNQVIANTEENGLCMVVNSRIKDGAYNAVDRSDCNKNIYVEGGIWSPNRHNDIKKLDKRTDPTWPTTWFAPILTGHGAFKDVYSVMANWGANHGVTVGGHVGADLITLCSMLRIPVTMHNVPDEKVYRPHAWASFGTEDAQAADYAACKKYGPRYK